MKQLWIPPFHDIASGEAFMGAWMYYNDEQALLLNSYGKILLCEYEIANHLAKQKIAPILLPILRSRQFLESVEMSDSLDNSAVEYFMVDMTKKCNMRCIYCLRNIENETKSISYDVLSRIGAVITEYCDTHNLSDVSIQPWGGEPLLELEKIIFLKNHIMPKETSVHFSIETNGTLLSENVIQTLKNEKIDIGISIDGNQHTHDNQRISASFSPTYGVVSSNLKKLVREYSYQPGSITTITKYNAPYISDIVEHFAKDLGLTHIKCNFVHPSSFSESTDCCLTSDEIKRAECELFHTLLCLSDEGYHIVEENIFNKINNVLFCKFSDICISRGCNGGKKMVVFGENGDIYPCELTDYPEMSVGNVFMKDFNLDRQIGEAQTCNPFFREKINPKCIDCPFSYYCKGGCTVRSITTGAFPDVDPIECACNLAIYPEIICTILNNPERINKLLGYQAIVEIGGGVQ